MRNKSLFFICATIFILACGIFSDEEPVVEESFDETETSSSEERVEASSEVDAIMTSYFSSDAPGASVMVIQNGEVVHQNGYGLADVDNERAITPNTIFHLGSVGKQFTAMGIMILAEDGLLNYDAPIGEYLTELEWMGDEVSVRSLLHHTSGVLGYDDSDEIYNALINSAEHPSNQDLLNVLAEVGDFQAESGEEFSYSNTGYDILGALIERLSGQTYASFMQERIFDKLGMLHSFALPNDARLSGASVAESYYLDGDIPTSYEPDELDNLNGSGSIYSNVSDMFLYDQALRQNTLVTQETLTEAHTSGVLNNGESIDYGFGVELGNYKGIPYIGHSGAWLGFESYYLHVPEKDLSIVVLMNFDYSESGAEGIAFEIADLYLK
jgi:CubicO group peptidase (beta-lactamase class C family)